MPDSSLPARRAHSFGGAPLLDRNSSTFGNKQVESEGEQAGDASRQA